MLLLKWHEAHGDQIFGIGSRAVNNCAALENECLALELKDFLLLKSVR
jgi:hypothetical protein